MLTERQSYGKPWKWFNHGNSRVRLNFRYVILAAMWRKLQSRAKSSSRELLGGYFSSQGKKEWKPE